MCLKPGIPPIHAHVRPYLRKSVAGLDAACKSQKNSEKRKEKSRDAARSRRGKESEIFNQLARTLPLPSQCVAQLDKASIMRLCIAYLKTRALASKVLSSNPFADCPEAASPVRKIDPDSFLEYESHSILLKALDGFLLVLSHEGDVIYTSENISAFLGISQVDVMGQSLLDYTHPCDHEEVRTFASPSGPNPRHAFLRLKSTLTAKGRNVNLKSATFKVVQLAGQLFRSEGGLEMGKGGVEGGGVKEEEGFTSTSEKEQSWIITLGIPVPHPSNIEFPLDKQIFISKHSLDMKFIEVDKNITSFCGYNPEDLEGYSLYELHHALDSHLVKDAYKTLRQKGQVETTSYRFLAYGGGYVWVVTQATLISGPKDSKPQYVVCLNYVISDIEEKGQVFSYLQLKAATRASPDSSYSGAVATPPKKADSNCHSKRKASRASAIPPVQAPYPSTPLCRPFKPKLPPTIPSLVPRVHPNVFYPKPLPVASTFHLLTDRTEDMNEGYLTFTNNDPQTAVLEQQPKDLTHLAPSGGDDLVPLEIPTFVPDYDNLLCEDRDPLSIEPYGSSPWSPSNGNFGASKRQPEHKKQPISSPTITSATNLDDGADSPPVDGLVKPSTLLGNAVAKNERSYSNSPITLEEGLGGAPFGSAFDKSPASHFENPKSQYSPAPLLSQSASNTSPASSRSTSQSSSPINRPQPGSSLRFYEEAAACSTMDIFSAIDLKLEDSLGDDDMDLKAPMEEMLVCESDLYGPSSQESLSSPSLSFSPELDNLDDDSSSVKCHTRQKDSPFLRSHSPCPQQRLSETGGSFVDPNQVLPGQYIVNGEDDDNSQELRHLLEDSPTLSVKDQVETPPPLFSPLQESAKRLYSPTSSPLLGVKRIRRPSACRQPLHLAQSSNSARSNNPDTIPPPPYAPTMQRLLVSKEPITVRGRFVSSSNKTSAASKSRPCKLSPPAIHSTAAAAAANGSHSVLRNLLVSGRDDLAGYTVVVSSISSSAHSPSSSPNSTPNSVSSSHSNKGSKPDVDDCSNLPSIGSLDSFPVNRDGKFEFTREELTSLLSSAGLGNNPRIRFLQAPTQKKSPPPVPCSSSASSSAKPLKTEGEQQPQYCSKGFKLQDPCMLVNPNVTIPSLLELTSFDYDVNAPAPTTCLLQGADLLMALDQTL